MHLIRHVLVVVPARNEAEHIAASLDGIEAARRRITTPSSVVVVADSCDDDTARVAQSHLRPADTVVGATAGSAGAARRLGTALGLAPLTGNRAGIWIATTDADSVVPEDWLLRQVHLARGGVLGVAGTVRLSEDVPSQLRERFRDYYKTGPGEVHGHVHGANLGVRADAYLAAGGWSPIQTGEDHDLWNRITRLGPWRSTTSIAVTTSARLTGRAPAGFAADLAGLARPTAKVA